MNPMRYTMRPMHRRGMPRKHVNTARDTRTPSEQEKDLEQIRERLYKNLELMRDINRVQTRMVRPGEAIKNG
jgi:hypothetical protein